MTIPTFIPPIPPSPGTSNKPEFAILSAPFGDGYTQESPDGLNNIRDVFTLTWDCLLPNQASAILTFIRQQQGCLPFYYTVSDNGGLGKWTCKDFTNERIQGGLRKVTMTLRACFNLDI